MDKSEFRKILKKVEKPARYLGNEVNSIHKDTSNKDLIRYVQCFPDLYEVGMSHLGSHILYDVINRDEKIFCERVYAPAVDMENMMRDLQSSSVVRSGKPIFLQFPGRIPLITGKPAKYLGCQ